MYSKFSCNDLTSSFSSVDLTSSDFSGFIKKARTTRANWLAAATSQIQVSLLTTQMDAWNKATAEWGTKADNANATDIQAVNGIKAVAQAVLDKFNKDRDDYFAERSSVIIPTNLTTTQQTAIEKQLKDIEDKYRPILNKSMTAAIGALKTAVVGINNISRKYPSTAPSGAGTAGTAKSNTMKYVLIGGAVLLLGGIAYMIFKKR